MTLSKLFSIHLFFIVSCNSIVAISGIANAVDIQTPDAPTNTSIANITKTSIDFSWTAPASNADIVAYNVYLNGSFYMSTDEFTFTKTVSNLTPFTWNTLQITSSDAAGNESNIKYHPGAIRTDPTCGITNNWVGNTADYGSTPLNWSESSIANECQDVVIDNGASVTVPSNRSYACETFEVGLGSEIIVDIGSEFHVIPSEAGPFSITGFFEDKDPPCVDPIYCSCCSEFYIIDNVNCWYIYQGDILVLGTYTISGNILRVTLESNYFVRYNPFYRIIDNNTIIEIGTGVVLSQ